MANKVQLNAETINKKLSENHLSKAYVSKKCGFGEDYLSKVLCKNREVTIAFANMVASIIEVDIDEIIMKKPKEEVVQVEFLTADNLRKCTDIDTVVQYMNAANEAFGRIMKGIMKDE